MRNGLLKCAGALVAGVGAAWAGGPVPTMLPPPAAAVKPASPASAAPAAIADGVKTAAGDQAAVVRPARTASNPTIIKAAALGQPVGGRPVLTFQEAGTAPVIEIVTPAPAASAPIRSAPIGSAPIGSAPISSAPARSAPAASAPAATGAATSAATGAAADAPPALSHFPENGDEACIDHREPCGPPGRAWVSAEYLLWWLRGSATPPLVTTGPATGGGLPGSLGAPGTVVLFGGDRDDDDPYSGFRVTAGLWCDDCRTHGIEASYFHIFPRSNDFSLNSDRVPVIARPFINTGTGAPDVEFVAFPGLVTGNIRIDQETRLQGADVNYICNLCCTCTGRTDIFAGVRYLELSDHLDIVEDVLVDPSVPGIGGARIIVADSFATRNSFYGGQIGVRREIWRDRFFVSGTAKLALGSTHQVVDINGSTTIIVPGGAPTTVRGGLLALSSNIGHYDRDRFSVVPEIGINVGMQVSDRLRVFGGYNFLYWTNVVRAGEQIDLVLNPNLIPTSGSFGTPGGPARPAFNFNESNFWAHGINVGVELRF
jgi:hypothetical protein